MNKLFVTIVAMIFLAPAATWAAELDAEELISRYDLQVADTPVRERDDWRKPAKVVVLNEDHRRIAWLQDAVPDVEVIGAEDQEEALEFIADADAVIGLCNREILEAGEKLSWIQLMSAGVEHCVGALRKTEREPLLTNMQRITGPVIAEHVLALTLALSRGLYPYAQAQLMGDWQPGAPGDGSMQVIHGKTMLVVGLGGIGTETAKRAHALGMTVTAIRASRPEGPDYIERVGLPGDLPEMIEDADVVVNALPLTDDTRGLFDESLFSRMKSTALFINVGRGGTVVQEDLVEALTNGDIGGAGLDVTDPEPLPQDDPLWIAPNIIITPHVATRSDLGRESRWQVVRENLRRYVAGEPMLSVVDLQRGY